jgi:hypothetical protein
LVIQPFFLYQSEAFSLNFFFYVPCFYTPAHAKTLYLKNLSGPYPGNFTGSGISSRLKRTLKTKAGGNKMGLKSK